MLFKDVSGANVKEYIPGWKLRADLPLLLLIIHSFTFLLLLLQKKKKKSKECVSWKHRSDFTVSGFYRHAAGDSALRANSNIK